MEKKFLARLMQEKDLDGVLEVEECSFLFPWSRESFEHEIRENKLAKYIVVHPEDDEDKIVAYAGMWVIVDEAHVTNVAVLPDHRGLGLGKYLMAALIQESIKHNVTRMTLEVRATNNIAQTMYRELGFKEAGVRKNYYKEENEDAIIMWKEY